MANIVDEPYRIVAMTYNVCFGCMYSDMEFDDDDNVIKKGTGVFDVTSRELIKTCTKKTNDEADKHNVCLSNIQTVFEKAKTEFNGLDLVGIQEASNWETLIAKSPLSDLAYINHKVESADMVSLYNTTKFKLDAFIVGNLSKEEFISTKTNLKTDKRPDGILNTDYTRTCDGRPYQLLFLTHKSSINKKYIFINIHNGHNNDRQKLIQALAKERSAFIPNAGTVSFKNCTYQEVSEQKKDAMMDPTTYTIQGDYKTTIDATITENSYEIIFMGDTNDKTMKLWTADTPEQMGLQPVTSQTQSDEATDTNIEAYNKVAPTDNERKDEEEHAQKDINSEELFKPLTGLGIKTSVSSKAKKPPRSCCVGKRNLRGYAPDTYQRITTPKNDISKDTDNRIGDYILISKNLTYEEKKNNVIPDFEKNAKTFPTSDHLPVVSVILLPQILAQPEQPILPEQPEQPILPEQPEQPILAAQGGSRRHRRKHKSARQLHTRNRHKHKQTKLKNTKTKRIYKK